MLELRGVHKIYQTGKTQVHALRGVDFKAERGEFVVIRGPSGSGKSTLLNILGLLDEPTEGDVLLKNEKVSFKDFDALATLRSRSISFIFQSFNLNPVLTVEENILVPLMIRSDIPAAEKQSRARTWIGHVGLEQHRDHRPDELSGGQRQRVAIARAMVSHPEIVIADEPTASLDSVTTRGILQLMRELNDDQGMTFLFATHDPVLDEFSKRTVHLKDGVIS